MRAVPHVPERQSILSLAEVSAVLAASGVEVGHPASVERIKHGLTNASWRVRGPASDVVVRLSNTDEDSLQIDRASEARIMALVAGEGIGPEVIHSDPARHILVTRYAGMTWSDADAVEPSNVERIATLLCKLHALRPPAGIRRVDLRTVIDGYLDTLDGHGVACEASASKLRTRAHEVAALLQQQPELRLCHNDVHAFNIVDDGALRLIDWEYAGLGERFFDLASICVYQKYDKVQRERLLRAYEVASAAGASTLAGQSWHRLELCCWLFDYVRDLWTAVREIR